MYAAPLGVIHGANRHRMTCACSLMSIAATRSEWQNCCLHFRKALQVGRQQHFKLLLIIARNALRSSLFPRCRILVYDHLPSPEDITQSRIAGRMAPPSLPSYEVHVADALHDRTSYCDTPLECEGTRVMLTSTRNRFYREDLQLSALHQCTPSAAHICLRSCIP